MTSPLDSYSSEMLPALLQNGGPTFLPRMFRRFGNRVAGFRLFVGAPAVGDAADFLVR